MSFLTVSLSDLDFVVTSAGSALLLAEVGHNIDHLVITTTDVYAYNSRHKPMYVYI